MLKQRFNFVLSPEYVDDSPVFSATSRGNGTYEIYAAHLECPVFYDAERIQRFIDDGLWRECNAKAKV